MHKLYQINRWLSFYLPRIYKKKYITYSALLVWQQHPEALLDTRAVRLLHLTAIKNASAALSSNSIGRSIPFGHEQPKKPMEKYYDMLQTKATSNELS